MAGKLKERLGISEITAKDSILWKALLAEFVGNVILNFFGCASCIHIDPSSPADLVLIALSFGLAVFVIIQVNIL